MLIGYLWRLITRLINTRRESVATPALAGATTAGAPAAVFVPAAEPKPASGPLGLLFHQAKYEFLASRRNPRARFFTYIFPVLLLVVFSSVFGHGHTTVAAKHVALTVFYVPGIMAMSVMTAAYAGMVVQVTTLRQTGVFKRRRATPLPAWALIASSAIVAVTNTFMMSALLLLISRFAYSVSFGAGPIAAMFMTVLAGTLCLTCISFAIAGLIGTPEAAQPVVQITMLPLYFISGIFIPASNLGSTVNTIAKIFPIEHVANSLHKASVASTFGSAFKPTDLLILGAWALAAIAFGAWKFSWLPSRS